MPSRFGLTAILLGLFLWGMVHASVAPGTSPSPPSSTVSFHPRARYYPPQPNLPAPVPACLLVVRNDGGDTRHLQGAEGKRAFSEALRFWHGQPLRMVVPYYRWDGSVVTLAPGDSVFVEALLMELNTDAFQLRLYRAAVDIDSTGAAPTEAARASAIPTDTVSAHAVPADTASTQTASGVTLKSATINLNDAPYFDLLTKEQAVFAARRGFPGGDVTRRHQALVFDAKAGWIWRVTFFLNGTRQVQAWVNAITGAATLRSSVP
jgi:hypothetical protein